MAERIRAVEEAPPGAAHPRSRRPGLATAVASWARGASFATALRWPPVTGELAPGDFVRTMKSVADLAQQVSHVARPDTGVAAAARRPSTLLLRGVGAPGGSAAAIRDLSATVASPSFYGRPGMFPYSEESFTADEEAILRRYVTNLDQPVFALVNLPEVVKGALFARYSRSPKSLRRLFLDEFVGDLDISGDATRRRHRRPGPGRAALREGLRRVRRRLGGPARRRPPGLRAGLQRAVQGARVGAAHVLPRAVDPLHRLQPAARQRAATATSGRPRSSTRRSAPATSATWTACSTPTASCCRRMQAWVAERFPQQAGDSDFVYRQAMRAKSLDALRGLLPAASLSNIGIYGTGQSYEQLLLRMRAHPLPEARAYADMMLDELRKVIPSFLQRVDVAERGGEWSDYLAWPRVSDGAPRGAALARCCGLAPGRRAGGRRPAEPEVTLARLRPRRGGQGPGRGLFLATCGCSEREAARTGARCSATTSGWRCWRAYVGERRNRRHRPGRAFERTDYRFELVTDYGAFRDLQRHRMLTIEWQPLGITPRLRHARARGRGRTRRRATTRRSERAEELYRTLAPDFPEQASYAVALAHRIRYVMQMQRPRGDAPDRAALGHPGPSGYRRVAQQMHRAIAERAGHRRWPTP